MLHLLVTTVRHYYSYFIKCIAFGILLETTWGKPVHFDILKKFLVLANILIILSNIHFIPQNIIFFPTILTFPILVVMMFRCTETPNIIYNCDALFRSGGHDLPETVFCCILVFHLFSTELYPGIFVR